MAVAHTCWIWFKIQRGLTITKQNPRQYILSRDEPIYISSLYWGRNLNQRHLDNEPLSFILFHSLSIIFWKLLNWGENLWQFVGNTPLMQCKPYNASFPWWVPVVSVRTLLTHTHRDMQREQTIPLIPRLWHVLRNMWACPLCTVFMCFTETQTQTVKCAWQHLFDSSISCVCIQDLPERWQFQTDLLFNSHTNAAGRLTKAVHTIFGFLNSRLALLLWNVMPDPGEIRSLILHRPQATKHIFSN